MDLNRCAKCGTLFPSKDDLCMNCKTKDLQDLGTVRRFLIENPEIRDLSEISAKTNVSEKDILRYISNDRLDDIESLGKYFKCTSCSTPIVRGKYCDECLQKLNSIKSQLLKNK